MRRGEEGKERSLEKITAVAPARARDFVVRTRAPFVCFALFNLSHSKEEEEGY